MAPNFSQRCWNFVETDNGFSIEFVATDEFGTMIATDGEPVTLADGSSATLKLAVELVRSSSGELQVECVRDCSLNVQAIDQEGRHLTAYCG